MQENVRLSSARLSYRLEEVAEATGLSLGMVRKEVREGKLKARHIGRAVVVLSEDLEIWLKGKNSTDV
jgi:excisionase family DNA binding protein